MGTRRSDGEGTLSRSGTGWIGQIRVTDAAGRRKRVARRGRTQAEVRAALRDVREAYARGSEPPPRSLTVAAYAERWLASKAATMKPSALKAAQSTLRAHVIPALGERPLASVRRSDIEALLASETLAKRALRTRIRVLRVASSMFNQAVKDGLLPASPTAGVPEPRERPGVDDVGAPTRLALTREETAAIIETAHDRGLQAELRAILALLGLRAGEALGLRWGDYDAGSGTLANRRARGRVTRVHSPGCSRRLSHTPSECEPPTFAPILLPTKSRESTRTLPLAERVCAVIDAAFAEQNERRTEPRTTASAVTRALRAALPDAVVVRTADYVTPPTPEQDARLWREVCVAAIGRPVKLHAARHSAVTRALEAGQPVALVQAWAGHSTLAMTQRYAAALEEPMRAAGASVIPGRFGSEIDAAREAERVRAVRTALGPVPSEPGARRAWAARARLAGIDPASDLAMEDDF